MPRPPKRTPEEARIGRREAVRRYSVRNREIVKARTQAWRDANREHISAYDKDRRSTQEYKKQSQKQEKERYAKDPNKGKARAKLWRDKNPQKLIESAKTRWREHALESAAYTRKWRGENPDRVKATYKAWCAANIEKVREYGHTRRAIQRGSGGRITPKQIQELWDKQDGKCAYFAACGHVLSREGKWPAQLDHIEPLKPADQNRKPGAHSIDNAQLLCGLCNRKKKNKDPYAFTQAHEGRLFPDLPQKNKTS